ncbi:MAG: 3-oxoacyl-[acyl-carrier-protein] synthase [Candidatus Berkelbacteria bacterium]|nr:3-oxoacyl-[acyl-carrier-protein] synthase [Candidatus Berkelbacteria bacterium]
MRTNDRDQVVICGMGAVTPIGNYGQDDTSFWQALLAGQNNFKSFQFGNPETHHITAHVASEFDNFDFAPYAARIPALVEKRFRPLWPNMDRSIQLGLAAGLEALTMAGLAPDEQTTRRPNIGLIVGTSLGGGHSFEEGVRIFDERGKVNRLMFTVLNVMLNGLAGMGTISFALGGPSFAIGNACASANFALTSGKDKIDLGYADVVLIIGNDSGTTAFQQGCFNQMNGLSKSDGPNASKPFGEDRDGFVMGEGEGAGAVVLARKSYALETGMPILATVLGYAANSDAIHMSQPDTEGITDCMRRALKNSGLLPRDIAHVNAHATATPIGDVTEAMAIWNLFADPRLSHVNPARSPYVTATKANLGHTLGASGILGMISSICSMTEGILPPMNGFEIDPKCIRPWIEKQIPVVKDNPVHIVTEKTQADIPITLCNSFGFGGHNISVVVSRPDFQN